MVLQLRNPLKKLTSRLGKIRLLACDLDGTLLDSNNNIDESTLEALRELPHAGVQLALVSGRSDGFTRSYAGTIGGDIQVVSLNGALVCDSDSSVLHGSYVQRETGELVLDTGRNHPGTAVSVFSTEGIVSQVHPLQLPGYLEDCPAEQKRIEFPDDYIDRAVQYVVHGTYKPVKEIMNDVSDRFKKTIECIFYQSRQIHDSFYLEIRNRDVNKSTGLKQLAQHLGISRREIAAIGDYTNDREMCRFAGVSAAMRNAIPDLKSTADFVTRGTNDDGGAGEFVRLILESGRKK